MAAAYLDAAYPDGCPAAWTVAARATSGTGRTVLTMARRGHQLAAHLQRRAAVRRGRRAARRAGRDQLRGPGRDRARAARRPGRDAALPGADRAGRAVRGSRGADLVAGRRRRPGRGRQPGGHRGPVPQRRRGADRRRLRCCCASGTAWARSRCPAGCSRTCCCCRRCRPAGATRLPGAGCTPGSRATTAGSASARPWWRPPPRDRGWNGVRHAGPGVAAAASRTRPACRRRSRADTASISAPRADLA